MSLEQLSAGEAFDDFDGTPLGEGFITLQSSAGNRILFNSPGSAYAYTQANPGQFVNTQNGGTYNQNDDPV